MTAPCHGVSTGSIPVSLVRRYLLVRSGLQLRFYRSRYRFDPCREDCVIHAGTATGQSNDITLGYSPTWSAGVTGGHDSLKSYMSWFDSKGLH